MDEKEFEQAALLEQTAREAGVAAARERAKKSQTKPVVFSGTCITCEGEIQPERVDIGYYSCVDCAQQEELKIKLGLIRGVRG